MKMRHYAVYGLLMFFSTRLAMTAEPSGEPQLAKPSAAQYRWHEQERIAFLCLDPCTWQGREYDDHSTPLTEINPQRLDTEQWCRAAKAWGAREILFVAKHTGGFCWWQTETSSYGIKETAWKNGQGDVLAELSAACRKNGLNLGIYVYPGDDTWGAPMGSGGRTKDASKQEAYNQVYRQQITEVLTKYGPVAEVWFDGSCVIDVGDILAKHAPNAAVFQGPQATIRWPGTESGKLPYPAWNSLKSGDLKTGVATAKHGDPDGDAWAPLEADTTLYNHHWFWSPEKEKKRKSLDELMDIYYQSVGHGGVLLLNSTPNTDGLIPVDDMRHYRAFGAEIERRFQQPVAETKGKGAIIQIDFSQPTAVNHAIVMEEYPSGERIREYVIEGLISGSWKALADGVSVGRMKIDRFQEATVDGMRLRITKAVGEPLIRRFAVYRVDESSRETSGTEGERAGSTWQECGAWSPQDFQTGKARLEIDLSPFIPRPGQYEVQFERSDGHATFEIEKIELFYEGERATPSLLTQLDEPNRFNVNRTAQITDETRSTLRVVLSAAQAFGGKVLIRPQPER